MEYLFQKRLLNEDLRAADCKYREFSVKTKKSNFFTFGQDKPFGELFTKITIKLKFPK